MNMTSNPIRRVYLAGSICFLLASLSVAAYAQPRVVAIGDVHGAYPEFVRILQRTGLIDAHRRWIGGSATLIQLGDVVDRGKEGPACLDLLMDLERQAAKTRGRVIPLLGNHEVMNIMGDLRYVPPEMWRGFATDQSEKVRDRAYRDYLQFLSADRNHARAAVSAEPESERTKWMEDHPPGFFEYRKAFGPDGKYGRWVRRHPAIVQVGGGVFVHGGLNPSLQFRDVAGLAERVRKELAAFDSLWQALSEKQVIWRYMTMNEALDHLTEEAAWMESHAGGGDPETLAQVRTLLGLRSWLCVSSDGPLWYRGLAVDPEETLASGVQTMLERLKAQYLVAGHTVQANSQIAQRFDHRVFLIDTGMNGEAFGGTASALQIEDGRFTAFYANRDPIILIARRPVCSLQVFPGKGLALRIDREVCFDLLAQRPVMPQHVFSAQIGMRAGQRTGAAA